VGRTVLAAGVSELVAEIGVDDPNLLLGYLRTSSRFIGSGFNMTELRQHNICLPLKSWYDDEGAVEKEGGFWLLNLRRRWVSDALGCKKTISSGIRRIRGRIVRCARG
jgi:hypothetical protein